ncbi:hypothetical protein ElyMa_003956600 [Elysia marginata]|uniref:Uncharacterized protein n=1 Tax=Elysia marginata TaxID=1093978 RepID=A0AAV4FUQ9_9GAST|nr:hypothetical protein ElyMa_003956600 [Elysia marginata]
MERRTRDIRGTLPLIKLEVRCDTVNPGDGAFTIRIDNFHFKVQTSLTIRHCYCRSLFSEIIRATMPSVPRKQWESKRKFSKRNDNLHSNRIPNRLFATDIPPSQMASKIHS